MESSKCKRSLTYLPSEVLDKLYRALSRVIHTLKPFNDFCHPLKLLVLRPLDLTQVDAPSLR